MKKTKRMKKTKKMKKMKKRGSVFFAKIPAQIKVRCQWFDQHLSRRVVYEKRHVQRLVRNFFPVLILAFPLLPRSGVVQKAWFPSDRRRHGVRTSRHAIDFDQPQRGTPDSRVWRRQQQAPPRQQLKADGEKVHPSGHCNQRQDRQVIHRDEERKEDGGQVLSCIASNHAYRMTALTNNDCYKHKKGVLKEHAKTAALGLRK